MRPSRPGYGWWDRFKTLLTKTKPKFLLLFFFITFLYLFFFSISFIFLRGILLTVFFSFSVVVVLCCFLICCTVVQSLPVSGGDASAPADHSDATTASKKVLRSASCTPKDLSVLWSNSLSSPSVMRPTMAGSYENFCKWQLAGLEGKVIQKLTMLKNSSNMQKITKLES